MSITDGDECPRCFGLLLYDSDLLGMVCLNCGRCYYTFIPDASLPTRKPHNSQKEDNVDIYSDAR